MTLKVIPVHVSKRDGEIMISLNGHALLYGIPLDDIEHLADNTTDLDSSAGLQLTDAMKQNGKRRTREAFAATGEEDIWLAMKYWGAKEYDAYVNIIVEESARNG